MTKIQRPNPGGLPYGCGSLQKRSLKWYAIYVNADGVKIQETTKTDDLDEARRFLVARALEVARARVAVLEKAYEAATVPAHAATPGRRNSRRTAGTGNATSRSRSGGVLNRRGKTAKKGGRN